MKALAPLHILENHQAISLRAAEIILQRLKAKPDLLLCAPGGSTPAPAYELLAEKRKETPDAFGGLRIVKLDEWGGISMDDPGSCETQLQNQLIKPLGV